MEASLMITPNAFANKTILFPWFFSFFFIFTTLAIIFFSSFVCCSSFHIAKHYHHLLSTAHTWTHMDYPKLKVFFFCWMAKSGRKIAAPWRRRKSFSSAVDIVVVVVIFGYLFLFLLALSCLLWKWGVKKAFKVLFCPARRQQKGETMIQWLGRRRMWWKMMENLTK